MELKKNKQIEDFLHKYPLLAILFPALGGFFAWQASGNIWIGLAILLFGLVSNYLFLFHRK